MQYTININQQKALEWGLNSQQAILFSFVYEVPSWAEAVSNEGGVYFKLAKTKVVAELPLLTDRPDTAYRMLRALRDKGLIEMSSTPEITLVRLTEKARSWNKLPDGSEKNPSRVGKKSEQGRKKIRAGSEKSPTDHDTSDPSTRDHPSHGASDGAPRPANAYPEDFEDAWFEYPAREGSNPKNHAYSAWKARLAEGVTTEQMVDGVRRYAAFCQAKGSTGTSYVMQAKRFFGTAREFENGWQVVAAPPERFGRSLTQADRVHEANQQAIRQAVENRARGDSPWSGDTIDHDGGHF